MVLDAGANKVRVFSADGTGPGLRQQRERAEGFDEPRGLAVDDRGNIYVADTGNHKIKKFDPRERCWARWFGRTRAGAVQGTVGRQVDREAKIHLLDRGKHTLQLFACEKGDGEPLEQASPSRPCSLRRRSPARSPPCRGKACLGDHGRLPDCRERHRGRKIGSRGSEPGMLKNPRGSRWTRAATSGSPTRAMTAAEVQPRGEPFTSNRRGGSKDGEFDARRQSL